MAQPDLDYIAPEIQLETGKGNTYLCDMFSLGMTICAIYNNGQSLIQANHSTSGYAKRIEMVRYLVRSLIFSFFFLKDKIFI